MKKDNLTALLSFVIVGACLGMGYYVQDNLEKNNYSGSISDQLRETELTEAASEYVTSENITASETTASVSVSTVSSAASVSVTTAITTVVSETSVSDTVTEITESEQTSQEEKNTETAEPSAAPEPEHREEHQPETEPPRTEPPVQAEPEYQPGSVPESATEFQREVVRLVNEFRAENDVGLLACTEEFNRGADIRAAEICGYFSHQRPDGREWYTVFTDLGLSPGCFGENIAAGSSTPQDVFDQWVNSTEHRKNMLNSEYKVIGIGYAKTDSDYQHYWVQLFG